MSRHTTKKKQSSGGITHANVFLVDSGDHSVSERAEQLIKRVTSKPLEANVGRTAGGKVRLGKVSELAQSFSLDAAPHIIHAIKQDAEVKDVILPNEAAKSMIKPTKSRRVKLANAWAKK